MKIMSYLLGRLKKEVKSLGSLSWDNVRHPIKSSTVISQCIYFINMFLSIQLAQILSNDRISFEMLLSLLLYF